MTRHADLVRHRSCWIPLVGLFVAAACHASPSATKPPPAVEHAGPSTNADLEARYRLAIDAFDRGAYDDAAQQFSQMLLRVPRDPSGDALRHLLIQHIAWSLLGSYDMTRDPSKLDSGEAMLERYLLEHEQLLPAAKGEREEIYELLGEYALRRDDQPPSDANAQLQELVRDTHANLQRPEWNKRGHTEDRMVREIEVHTQKWATLEDPRVQSYFRDLRYTGGSMFDVVRPYNPARVLVRGFVGRPLRVGDPANRHAYAALREARPELASCYEDALGRGAETLERVELELRFGASAAEIVATERSSGDDEFSRCVIDALRDGAKPSEGEHHAELRLTFFVQPARYPPMDTGEITKGASPEDVTITRCVPGPGLPTRC